MDRVPRLVGALGVVVVAVVAVGALVSLVETLTAASEVRAAAVVTSGLLVAAVVLGTVAGTRSVSLSTEYW